MFIETFTYYILSLIELVTSLSRLQLFFVCLFLHGKTSEPSISMSFIVFSPLCSPCVGVSDGFLGPFFRKIPAGKRDIYTRTLQMNPSLNKGPTKEFWICAL